MHLKAFYPAAVSGPSDLVKRAELESFANAAAQGSQGLGQPHSPPRGAHGADPVQLLHGGGR